VADAPPRAVDAAHLTEALRRCGALPNGSVRSVVVENTRPTVLSRILRLRLTYDGTADGPTSLILKTGLAGRTSIAVHAGRREAAFYEGVAPATPPGLVPRCFEAAHDGDTPAWHLLLEDLTDTHKVVSQWPLPPTLAECEHLLDALARFHAAWWDEPRLGVSVGTWLDADAIERQTAQLAQRVTVFVDRLGDRLSAERRDLYTRLLDAAPRLYARYTARRHLTIVHGDAHVWNALLPRDGAGDVRLFDWDSWRIDAASDDLAYMMALHWYPERRRRMERHLLDHYHAVLLAGGVRDYDRRSLDDDYRLSVLWQITVPVWQATNDLPPAIWWSHLERIMLAVDDLDCRALL
jgi:hypothetical protein